MARLRASTGAAHARLHAAPMLAPLTGGPLSVEAYRAILAHFDAVFASAEADGLAPFTAWFAARDFAWLSRRPALARDLADLEALDDGAARRPQPAPPRLDLPAGPGGALGVLYVVEGSRLGGRTLARHLSQVLPAEAAGATRFLGSTGEDVGARWRAVGAFIDRHGVEDDMIAAAETAACRLFGVLELWFAEAQ